MKINITTGYLFFQKNEFFILEATPQYIAHFFTFF
jgi:hypothetical protein